MLGGDRMKALMWKYVLTWLVSVAIVVLSTIPIPEHPPLGDVPLIDKWVHMVMYGGLTLVMWADRVVRNRLPLTKGFQAWMVVYPVALGGLMELVQAYWTTCRSGDWIDFEADAVGVALMWLCCLFFNRIWKEKILVQK